jgi:hypothetical protein
MARCDGAHDAGQRRRERGDRRLIQGDRGNASAGIRLGGGHTGVAHQRQHLRAAIEIDDLAGGGQSASSFSPHCDHRA